MWTEPWIPSSHDRRVTSIRGGAIYTKVSELIDPLTGRWHVALLDQLFNPLDAQRILQILIHNQGFDDFLA
jgi:hypothetical protein